MAYRGYLIKIGGQEILPQDMKIDSYQVTWNSQDLNAYRDASGELHRTALKSRPVKVEFYTRNMMTNEQLSVFLSKIRSKFDSSEGHKNEKRASAEIYVPEIDDYVKDDVYMADTTPSMYRVDGMTIYYNSFRVAFIGYGVTGNT